MSGGLTPERRASLAVMAELIAPATAKMPAAGTLGLAEPGGLIDRVLALRPDLASDLAGILDRVDPGADPATALNLLQRAEPLAFSVLMQVVAGAYYLHPEVKARIRYPGQQAQSLDRGGIGGEELLAAMMERPPRWRRADPATAAPP